MYNSLKVGDLVRTPRQTDLRGIGLILEIRNHYGYLVHWFGSYKCKQLYGDIPFLNPKQWCHPRELKKVY